MLLVKLSSIDKKILEFLRQTNPGASLKNISLALERYPPQIILRLHRLEKHGVLVKIPSKPTIWKIKLGEKKVATILVVECPKCGQEHKIHDEQQTILCSNKECLTKSNHRTRFHVTDKRIIGAIKI